MLKSTEVKVFVERLYCDECGEEMVFSGMVLCSYPPKYPHECPKCGFKTTMEEQYPKIQYK